MPDTGPQLAAWVRQDQRLVAPSLWLAEVTSGIRRAVHGGAITDAEGRGAFDDVMAFGVELVEITPDHGRAALRWAARLRQARAYDAFYLALAEGLGVEFWTVDQRLANAARRERAGWVHALD